MARQITGIVADGPTNINILPDEMLLKVFSYLSAEDLGLNVQFVCVRWSCLSLDAVLWKDLLFSADAEMSNDYILTTLEKLPMLQSFHMDFSSAYILQKLADCCKNLRKLNVHSCDELKITEEALKNLVTECTSLEEFTIPDSALANEELAACVGQLRNLHSITLTGSLPINLKLIADGCPSLQHFDMRLTNCAYSDVKYFLEKKKNKLLKLGMSHISSDCACVFPLLAVCQNTLCELRLTDFFPLQYSYTELAAFSVGTKFSSLTSLTMDLRRSVKSDVMSNIFVKGAMSQLLQLKISSVDGVNATVVKNICIRCPNLLRLRIMHCYKLNDDGLKYVYRCGKLEELELRGCSSVTEAVMDHIVRCTKLNSLTLRDCKLTEKGLGRLLELSELRHLDLSHCKLSGVCFDIFCLHLKKLRILKLEYTSLIDYRALDALRAKMPHLHVIL